MYHFTGTPDFTINEKPKKYVLRYSARSIGEIQSPPDRKDPRQKNESKSRAFSQAAVYATGQLGKGSKPTSPRSMPAIVLYKDKTAQMALATVDPSQVVLPGSFGVVSFKFLETPHALNLTDPEDLKTFARVFTGILKTLQSSL